jgi:hypothetical protein
MSEPQKPELVYSFSAIDKTACFVTADCSGIWRHTVVLNLEVVPSLVCFSLVAGVGSRASISAESYLVALDLQCLLLCTHILQIEGELAAVRHNSGPFATYPTSLITVLGMLAATCWRAAAVRRKPSAIVVGRI